MFSGNNNPVVVVKGAKVSEFNGVTLSGGDIICNPDMPQVQIQFFAFPFFAY